MCCRRFLRSGLCSWYNQYDTIRCNPPKGMTLLNRNATVLIPVYNEEEALGPVLERLREAVPECEILVVDDGSVDRSAEIARQGGVRVISHSWNRGYGASLKTGLRHARNEHIVIVDGDGTYPTEVIPQLLERLDQCDMVVGARTGKGEGVSWLRQPAKWVLKKIADYLTSTRIPDLNSGLRAFKRKIALSFFAILPSGFSFTTTITLAMLTNDYAVQYLPITCRRRIGRSKIRPVRDTGHFFSQILRTVLYFDPLKIFIPLCASLLGFALVILVCSMVLTDKIMDTTVVIIVMTALELLVVGVLADLIGKASRRLEID